MIHSRPRTKEIIDPNHPLLKANRKAIDAVRRETFSYCSKLDLKLDVYYPPPQPLENNSNPILVFFYGGGFTSGSRSFPHNLVYNNLGAFFASRGIMTIIPDYRLVPSIVFPQGAEDEQTAIIWVIRRFPEATERVFVMGHSAGGVHLVTLVLTPSLFHPIASAIRGVVLMGVPVTIPPGRPGFSDSAVQYYGSQKAVAMNHPSGLLRRTDAAYCTGLPPMRTLRAGSEPRYITAGMREFVKNYAAKGGVIEETVLEGHDHLSPVLALSSGSGEEWGFQMIDWINGILQTRESSDNFLSARVHTLEIGLNYSI